MEARQQASTWLVAFDSPDVQRRLFGAATGSPEQAALVAAARDLVAEAVRSVAAPLPDGLRVELCDTVAADDHVVPVEVWSPALLAWRDGQLSRDAAVDGVRRLLADHVNHNTKAA